MSHCHRQPRKTSSRMVNQSIISLPDIVSCQCIAEGRKRRVLVAAHLPPSLPPSLPPPVCLSLSLSLCRCFLGDLVSAIESIYIVSAIDSIVSVLDSIVSAIDSISSRLFYSVVFRDDSINSRNSCRVIPEPPPPPRVLTLSSRHAHTHTHTHTHTYHTHI